MARISRVEIFAPDEMAIVHVMNRTVRRCFMLGNDPLTGKNFDHRKTWLDEELKRLAAQFGIDLLYQAILSNHFHLVLRSRPHVVTAWNDSEVDRRIWFLFPKRMYKDGNPCGPTQYGLNMLTASKKAIDRYRSRLSLSTN